MGYTEKYLPPTGASTKGQEKELAQLVEKYTRYMKILSLSSRVILVNKKL
jgi:hypothetical protein